MTRRSSSSQPQPISIDYSKFVRAAEKLQINDLITLGAGIHNNDTGQVMVKKREYHKEKLCIYYSKLPGKQQHLQHKSFYPHEKQFNCDNHGGPMFASVSNYSISEILLFNT